MFFKCAFAESLRRLSAEGWRQLELPLRLEEALKAELKVASEEESVDKSEASADPGQLKKEVSSDRQSSFSGEEKNSFLRREDASSGES